MPQKQHHQVQCQSRNDDDKWIVSRRKSACKRQTSFKINYLHLNFLICLPFASLSRARRQTVLPIIKNDFCRRVNSLPEWQTRSFLTPCSGEGKTVNYVLRATVDASPFSQNSFRRRRRLLWLFRCMWNLLITTKLTVAGRRFRGHL